MQISMSYDFRPISNAQLAPLRQEFYDSLSAPLDGMWDELIHRAVVKGIFYEGTCIGYFCHDQAYTLINFFVSEKWLNQKEEIIRTLLLDEYFPQAYVCTCNPCFLSAVLPLARNISVYYYLFEDGKSTSGLPRLPAQYENTGFRIADQEDVKKIVAFCQQTTTADKAWLTDYTRRWVEKEGIYYLTLEGQIIGTCELRKSETQPGYADLGAIVSPHHRKQGLGSYLMQRGKALCYQKGLIPICSCRFDNKGSRKMIENAGFVNHHLMLKLRFNV